MQHALDHGRQLRGRATLELGVDTGSATLHVPVDHDAASAIADVPLGHQVLVPGAELFAVGGTGRGALAPDVAQGRGERGVDDPADGLAQSGFLDETPTYIGQIGVADRLVALGHALQAGVGALPVETA